MGRKAITWGMMALALMLIVPRVWADGTPTPIAEVDYGDRLPANGASIRIVSPVDGLKLTSTSVLVKVETTNWPLGEGKHWHLYVNGQAQGMSQGSGVMLQAHDLQPGANVIEAVMSNAQHQELEGVARVTVLVDTPAPATGDSLPFLAGALLVVIAIGGAVVFWSSKK